MLKKLLPFLILFSLFSLSCNGLNHNIKQAPTLQVKRVVVYQNGIGYFEQRGKIEGEVLTVNVRHDQINDFLKSLAVIDMSEGRVINVSLPIEKRDIDRIASLPKQVREASGLIDVLRVFRGAMVTVRGKKTITGRVLGVEHITPGKMPVSTILKSSEPMPSGYRLTLMKQDGDLEVMPIEDVREVTIRDRTLEVGLSKSLDISLGEGRWKPVALKIRLTEADEHDLLLSYIVEMPRWKPTYRLVVGDDGTALIQAWAVVDNVSGEDWNKVSLSLVAGMPLSFKYDLHSPKFVRRVDMTPPDNEYAMAPPSEGAAYDVAGMAEAEDKSKSMRPRAAAKKSSMRGKKMRLGAAPMPMVNKEYLEEIQLDDYDQSYQTDFSSLADEVASQATGEQLGSLFRYDVKGPVTVKDNSSTMVAIVNSSVPGEEVWLFRRENPYNSSEEKPYRSIRIKNDSGYTLEKGPVALYSKGSFVGEGFLKRLEAGATTFVSFAIDGKLSLKIDNYTTTEPIGLYKIQDGMIWAETYKIKKDEFTVKNRNDEDGTAFIRRKKEVGYNLRNTPEGTVETGDSYYIPVKVPANKEAKLKVELVSPAKRKLAIDSDLSETVLKLYLGSGEIPAEVKDGIEKVLKLKGEISKLEKDNRRYRKSRNDYERDQQRLRSNLDILRKTRGNKDLLRELVKKLAEYERKLGKLSADIVKNDEEVAGLKARMDILIRSISLKEKK